MAWQAIECGLLRHHGHSTLCAIGVLINCITFEIAENARAYARAALGI